MGSDQMASLLRLTFLSMNLLNLSQLMVSAPNPPTEWMISTSWSSL